MACNAHLMNHHILEASFKFVSMYILRFSKYEIYINLNFFMRKNASWPLSQTGFDYYYFFFFNLMGSVNASTIYSP